MSDKGKHEWDRLPGESTKAYSAFAAYRDLGPDRSIAKAINASGKTTANLRQWEYWSSQHQWVDRASAYDDHGERRRLAQLEKERREMNERQAKIGVLGQNLAVKAVEKLLAEVQSGEKILGAAELARLLDVSAKLERLAHGESTDIHQAVGPGGGPVRLSIESVEQRSREAVEKSLGISDRGAAEREEARPDADLPSVPDPVGE